MPRALFSRPPHKAGVTRREIKSARISARACLPAPASAFRLFPVQTWRGRGDARCGRRGRDLPDKDWGRSSVFRTQRILLRVFVFFSEAVPVRIPACRSFFRLVFQRTQVLSFPVFSLLFWALLIFRLCRRRAAF